MARCNPNFLRALWPAFLVAVPGAALLFSAVDPGEVAVFGAAELSGPALYTLGFILVWLLCWASSALNLWMFASRFDAADDSED